VISGATLRALRTEPRDVQIGWAVESPSISTAEHRVAIGELNRFRDIERHDKDDPDAIAYGRVIANIGDFDGDGRDDLAIGATPALLGEALELEAFADPSRAVSPPRRERLECAEVRSIIRVVNEVNPDAGAFAAGVGIDPGMDCGSYGNVLIVNAGRDEPGCAPLSRQSMCHDDYAASLADGGDLDGDGVRDLVIGAPCHPGEVLLCSGATGAEIQRIREYNTPFGEFAFTLAAGADLDDDGVGEIAVAEPSGVADPHRGGSVWIYDGATRRRVARLFAPESEMRFGDALAFVRDLDEDGSAELVIGAPRAGDGRGSVFVVSGKSLTVLHVWRGDVPGAGLGTSLCCDADLDGDGKNEVIAGAPGIGISEAPRAVFVFSGRDGSMLLRIDSKPELGSVPIPFSYRRDRGMPRSYGFGWALATGNFDGDDVPDLAIGAPQRGPDDCIGVVHVVAGKTLREAFGARR